MQKYNDDSYAYVMLSEHARAVANQPDIKPGWQQRQASRDLRAAWNALGTAVQHMATVYAEVARSIAAAVASVRTFPPVLTPPAIPTPTALGVLRRAAAVNPPTTWKRPDRRGL